MNKDKRYKILEIIKKFSRDNKGELQSIHPAAFGFLADDIMFYLEEEYFLEDIIWLKEK